MQGPIRGRSLVLYCFLILALAGVPATAWAQESTAEAQLVPDAHVRDEEVILINRNDGQIVIRDYAVGPNQRDLSGKYSQWGGPYHMVATGDFNGDGTREIVVTGGRGVDTPGPILNVFDPVVPGGSFAVPNPSINVNPYDWTHLGTADVDGDGRDEIVAIRTANEPGNILARVQCYELEGNQWREKWSLATGGGFRDMTLGDYNGDGRADVLFARDFRYVLVLDGQNPTIEYFSAQVGGIGEWNKIRMGDINGDNSRDLILLRDTQAQSGNFPSAVYTIHPTGFNTWTDIFGWGFGDPPEDIELLDYNGDGRLEIAAMNTGTFARIYILNPRLNSTENNNTEDEQWIGDREWGPNLVVGDPNGNGRPEFLLIHTAEGDSVPDYFLRILGFHDAGGYADDTTNFPFWYNLAVGNLDGSGITEAPVMRVPSTVTLFVESGSGATRQETIRVENTGTGSFTWTASIVGAAAPWLTLNPTSGTSDALLTFSVNAAAVPAGGASTTVRVLATASGVSVSNGQQNINVNVVVVDQVQRQYLPLTFQRR
ncbi:MAG: FG-GAP-like repeat-containing protein [Anaerolineae bacterium]|jgi:hypothetical protein